MPEEQQNQTTPEVKPDVYYTIHVHFEKDCGVKNVVFNQTGKPGGGDPPPGTGGGGTSGGG